MRILIVDDEPRIRSSLQGLLEDVQYRAEVCGSGEECLKLLDQSVFDVIMLDVMLPGIDGLETLERISARYSGVKVLMMSGHADLSTAVRATRHGAVDFFEKPLNGDKVILALRGIERQIRLEKRVSTLETMVDEQAIMIGETAVMDQLFSEIEKAAPAASRILISGENGTGKEMVARAIHMQSDRRHAPFISLNCAAIPSELVESELFGHEKGAFTGAVARKAGRFELADTGTLFLDEIGDMSLPAQAKLLRVLQENEAVRVGGVKPYDFNVRVIAATNKNLQDEISAGRFREDLYYRINVIPIKVPALRERLADVPLLAVHFLQQLTAHTAAGARSFTGDGLACLQNYSWPGNIRELKNTVERLMIMSSGDTISRDDVAAVLSGAAVQEAQSPAEQADDGLSFRDKVENFEKKLLKEGLRVTDGNVSQLSRKLKMDRANLHRKLKAYGLKK